MAAALGLPWVPLAVTRELTPGVRLAESRGLSRQHTDRGLTATPPTARIHTWPNWLQDRDVVQPTGVLTMQTRPYDTGGPRDPAAADVPVKRGGCPTVLVTLGTVVQNVDLLARVVEAVASLDVDVLVTVPTGMALVLPAALSESERVRTVAFVPMQRLLDDVSVVVSAGGAGTVLACLGEGIAMALVPVLADQPLNAAAVARTGAGLVCQTPAQLTGAVARLLDEPGFALAAKEQATRLSAEVASPERVWTHLVERVTAAAAARALD